MSVHHAVEEFANNVELFEHYDKIRNVPIGNQIEASTTAVKVRTAECLLQNVFASILYTSPNLVRPRRCPAQECYSLKNIPLPLRNRKRCQDHCKCL